MADTLRIDKWLFFARFFKTRALATAAVAGGHVHRNGERAKPAAPVHVGDRLSVTKDRYEYVLSVSSIPARRGPAPEAAACYVEDAESIERREALAAALKTDRLGMPRTQGKPDKKTRRQIRRFMEQ